MNTPTTIEQMCIDAQKRLTASINRSAGQHLRAMRLSMVKTLMELYRA